MSERSFKSKSAAVKSKSPNKKVEKRGKSYVVTNTEAAERYKILKDKGVINFKYDLRKKLPRAAEKRIKRYWDEFEEILNQSTGLGVKRRKNNVKENRAYAEFTGQNPRLRGANFVYPKYSEKRPARLVYDKKTGKAKLLYLGMEIEQVYFDQVSLARDGMKYAKPLLDKITNRKGTNQSYVVMTGSHEIKRSFGKHELAPQVEKLLERYSPGGDKYSGKNDWREWGVKGVRFIGYADADNLRTETVTKLDKQNKKRQKRNRARRARDKR